MALLGHLVGDGSYLHASADALHHELCREQRHRAARSRGGVRLHGDALRGSDRFVASAGHQRQREPLAPGGRQRLAAGARGLRAAVVPEAPAASGVPARQRPGGAAAAASLGDRRVDRAAHGRAAEVTPCTTRPRAKGLAQRRAALLLRLGIVARIGVASKAGYRPSFHVRVSGVDAQRQFLERGGAFGPRAAGAADARPNRWSTCDANTNVDTLPKEAFVHVRRSMSERGITQRAMAGMRGTSYGGAAHFEFAPSRGDGARLRRRCSTTTTCASRRRAICSGTAWWHSSRRRRGGLRPHRAGAGVLAG